MTQRFAFLSVLVLLFASPCFAQDEKDAQIQELRERLNNAEDQVLEMARKFDMEKKRLQDEKEALMKEVALLTKKNALLEAKLASLEGKGGAKPDDAKKKEDAFLDEKKLTLNFNETPLEDVGAFLRDISGVNLSVTASVPDDAVVSLQVKNLTLRQVLDQLCESARDGEGEEVPLMWRLKSGVIQIAKKKTKKKG